MFFLVVSVILTLSACGTGSTTNEVNDSLMVQVDSTSAPVVDSVNAPVVEGGSSSDKPTEEVK